MAPENAFLSCRLPGAVRSLVISSMLEVRRIPKKVQQRRLSAESHGAALERRRTSLAQLFEAGKDLRVAGTAGNFCHKLNKQR